MTDSQDSEPVDRTGDRRAELVQGLGQVRARIADACQVADRPVSDVTLVVVTKTYPADDVALLAGLGVRDVGEAREQELKEKRSVLAPVADRDDRPAEEVADRDDGPGDPAAGALRWHLLGRLQRNKARSVGRLADVVHSVDDARLVVPLGRGADDVGRELGCFVQVSLDGDPGRGGVVAEQLLPLCDEVAAAPGLRLLGVMAVAPMGARPEESFARLRALAADVAQQHPAATAISAGMSGDLEHAVAHGATHLRVGAAVLGDRPPLD